MKSRKISPNAPSMPLRPFRETQGSETEAFNAVESDVLDSQADLETAHQEGALQAGPLVSIVHDEAFAPGRASSSVVEPEPEKPRDLRTINVNLIDPNPLAPREIYTAEMILARASDLRDQGQHDPIHVMPNPDAPGRFIILDGWTRTQACLSHKVMTALHAEVHHNLSLQQAAWFGYDQNECRQGHHDIDRAMFYEKLIAAGEAPADIYRRARISKSLMSFYRSYAKLPEDILEVVRIAPARFTATVAFHLLKAYNAVGVRKTVALANRFATEDRSQAWLADQVQSLINQPDGERKPTPMKHLVYENGQFKQIGSTFSLSIKVEDDQAPEFAEKIEKLLAEVAKSGGKAL